MYKNLNKFTIYRWWHCLIVTLFLVLSPVCAVLLRSVLVVQSDNCMKKWHVITFLHTFGVDQSLNELLSSVSVCWKGWESLSRIDNRLAVDVILPFPITSTGSRFHQKAELTFMISLSCRDTAALFSSVKTYLHHFSCVTIHCSVLIRLFQ